MVVQVLDALTMSACNIALMKLNATSSSTSLRRLDVFFTEVAMTHEILLILGQPLKSRVKGMA